MQLLRGIVRAYDGGTHCADVQPVRHAAALLTGLAVVGHCPPALVGVGAEVAVLLWPDVGGLVLGPYGAVVGDWALPGGLALAGGLELAHEIVTATHPLAQHRLSRVGLKENAGDNAAFDLVRFTSAGAGSHSGHRGVASGTLALAYSGRHTSGYSESVAARYFVTVYAHGSQNLKADIQLLGARNEEVSHAVTLTVSEKPGASRTSLIIQAQVTHAGFDANSNRTVWTFALDTLATLEGVHLTPSIC